MIYRASQRLSSRPGPCLETATAARLKVVDSSCGTRNMLARMPFRFGVITRDLTSLSVED
jgi:hypothetical protein